MRHELFVEHPTGLNEQAAVDRFVRDLHVLLAGVLA
jgi:hypothetical protein